MDHQPPSRSRAPEFYGFVAWTSTSLAFCLYVLWALVPDEYIVWVGIDWYPNREWALLIPAWSIMLIITTYIVYSSLAIAATPSFSDMSAITDNRAIFPLDPRDNTPYLNAGGSPELYDIPIGMVNRVMYSRQEPRTPAPS
ncbi:Phosphatidylinositol N-acetylglucosaminyltransferase subunit P [Hypsizygus marmoreus]|uniref:Phosphatidylinositol N-acetylglucosaminyltransferase subunit P n=1 Tax=Hypsizygus marmoreus TaxID=39966 RepID=A0A369KFP6_HYPMA|nr:Phosphatidylinositol N-acetylglucosaminyltransferase subunit P [Hypsizygus marmoreus]